MFVDPAFGSAYPKEGEEIHGLAYAVNKEDFDKCNKMEGGDGFYNRHMVTLHLYDGRKVEGQIYSKKNVTEEGTPSKRYLNLIINGAKEAGLDAAYIEKVKAHPIYTTPPEVLEQRKLIPKPEELPQIGFAELKENEHKDNRVHVCILGYIFKLPKEKIMMTSHIGRDITARQLRHYRGEATDPEDEINGYGRPPYPDVDSLTEDEREYLWQWVDHYLQSDCKGDISCIVGFIAEWDQKIKL